MAASLRKILSPLGDICPVKEIEDIGGGAEQAGNAIGSAAENDWNLTAPSRNWIKNNAQDFWKEYGSALEHFYKFAGSNWEKCRDGAAAGAVSGCIVGSVVPVVGSVAGTIGGGAIGCAGLVGANEGLKALAQ